MRSKTWVDEELRVVRIRCSKCMVAWGSGFSDYQQEDGDGTLHRLQDKQECEICGCEATGSCRLWIIRQVSGDQKGEISPLVCSQQGIREGYPPFGDDAKVHRTRRPRRSKN